MSIKPIGDTTTQGTIVYNVVNDLADNNNGSISAADIRENLKDLAESIISNVSSGDFNAAHPFVKNVRVKIHSDVNQRTNTGSIVVESGIFFDNDVADPAVPQTVPYPGPENINHNDLANLSAGHPHSQYVPYSGGIFTGTLGLTSGNWLNSRGSNIANKIGITFDGEGSYETLHIGSGTTLKFDNDNSIMTSARGVAKAWLTFAASGVTQVDLDSPSSITVKAAYNISAIERVSGVSGGERGKFKIYFEDDLFDSPNDYVAIGSSNARASSSDPSDFEVNTVGIVSRTADYLTFYVLDDDGVPRDGHLNDLIVFGIASGLPNNASSVTTRVGPA